jgi:hypothetical protein
MAAQRSELMTNEEARFWIQVFLEKNTAEGKLVLPDKDATISIPIYPPLEFSTIEGENMVLRDSFKAKFKAYTFFDLIKMTDFYIK